MARQASVRAKNGYWYSEAGDVGRYFGRCDEVTQTQATAGLWAALAGGDDKSVDRGVGHHANGDAGVCATPSPKASGRKERTKSRRTPTRDSSFLPSHAGDDAGIDLGQSPHPLSKPSPTIGDLTTLFLDWVKAHRAASNHECRAIHLERFAKGRATKPMASLNADDLEASFQASIQRYSPTYRRHHETSVRAMLRWEQGAEAAGGQPVSELTQLVVDVGGADHRDIALGLRAMGDVVEEPASPATHELAVAVSGPGAPASPGLGRENGHRSKPSVSWKDADPTQPTFFQDPGGFSSVSGPVTRASFISRLVRA